MKREEKLMSLIVGVLEDQTVEIELKHLLAKEGRALRDQKNSLSCICSQLVYILTPYVIKHKNKVPQSVKQLYQEVTDRGERYWNLAKGISSMGIWLN